MPVSVESEKRIDEAMLADRFTLRRLLRSMKHAQRSKRPFDRNLARFETLLAESIARAERRRIARPEVIWSGDLPVHEKATEIIDAIERQQVLIICGETGSGKSTQLPKMAIAAGRGIFGVIGHTQPRRIAARSVAARVAEELGSDVGRQVGYKVRFADATGPDTIVKLMTDGILLAETASDQLLDQYDTIIIDEAHERSLNIDFLLGYLKRQMSRRSDLKIIITSATIDAERFADHFSADGSPAPIIEVSGRMYPVEVRYRPPGTERDDVTSLRDADWQEAMVDAISELTSTDSGHVLAFLPTERDIRELHRILRGRRWPGDASGQTTEILPLYGRLSTKDQHRVFDTSSRRRIVLATNVAESSITVPGIRFVVDAGTARISRYSARSGIQRLPIEAISKASAEQRKGRCGRIGPGICVRLYSQADFQKREAYTQPEIQRSNLAAVILRAEALKLGRLEDFPFLDPPRPTSIRAGYRTLFELGAMDDQDRLTSIGEQLSRLPVDPRIGRMILAAVEESCLAEVLIIAAALEIQDPRERPVDKQQAADECHAQFVDAQSDFLSLLRLWDFYHELKGRLSRGQLKRACVQNFLSENRLREWSDLHRQLRDVLNSSSDQALRKAAGNTGKTARRGDADAIHRALLAGLLSGVAMRTTESEYTGSGNIKLNLWPGSGTFGKKPAWIVAAERVETNRRYARIVARINPAWIEALATHLVNRTYSEPHWNEKTNSVMAFERVTLFGLPVVARRQVRYGPIDAAASRVLFIQHGLVERRLETQLDFLKYNERILLDAAALQAKSRRHDMLQGEEAQFDFFDRVIPADVFDGATFHKWLRTAGTQTLGQLRFSMSDLLHVDAETVTDADFPNAIALGNMEFRLDYSLEPGTDDDGVTISVPQAAVNQLDRTRLGWLVPGLLEEKIVALIKSLPKPLRRNLVPAPDTAREVLGKLNFGHGDFERTLADMLSRIGGAPVSPSDFDPTRLPRHLRMNVRVIDDDGHAIAAERDFTELKRQVGADSAAVFATLDQGQWARDRITDWDFGDLPESVELVQDRLTLRGYPALIDRGADVSLCLRDSAERAARDTRSGCRRLFCIAENRRLKTQLDWLPERDRIRLLSAAVAGLKINRDLTDLLADRSIADAAIPRSRKQYEAWLKTGRNRISVAAQEISGLIKPLLDKRQRAIQALDKSAPAVWRSAMDDMRDQVEHLFQPGFLTSTPWPWLMQLPRYLDAIDYRISRLQSGGGPAADGKRLAEIRPHWMRYLELWRSQSDNAIPDPAVIQYRWMIEEFRVSLFAQQLRTAIPVSGKRLDAQWQRVRHDDQ